MVKAGQMQDSHNGLLRARGKYEFRAGSQADRERRKTAINRTGIIWVSETKLPRQWRGVWRHSAERIFRQKFSGMITSDGWTVRRRQAGKREAGESNKVAPQVITCPWVQGQVFYCSFSGIKPPAMPVESRALASSKKPPVLQWVWFPNRTK